MISKLKFTCIYILLVPCSEVLLIIIVILIVAVVVAIVIVPFDEWHTIILVKWKIVVTKVIGITSSTMGIAIMLLLLSL